jgi:ABC-2 type transport system permease protein
MSLFAILFAFGAVNGEKERGTLRLAFSNPVPRASFIIGKWAGSFLALCVPMLVPVLIGCLLLPALGVHLEPAEWLRLSLVLLAGFLFFGAFLSLSIMASTVTRRSSSSFLALLIAWIFLNLIIPRTAVLLAAGAVDVPSIDDMNAQKTRYMAELIQEQYAAMEAFKPTQMEDPEKAMGEFNEFMDGVHAERDRKLKELADRLSEERRNRQRAQRRLAFGLARISPCTSFTLAADRLAGTSLELGDRFLAEASGYQQSYGAFMKEKTGVNTGAVMIKISDGTDETRKEAINPAELPAFAYRGTRLDEDAKGAVPDLGLLALFNIVFFAGAFAAFLRFDVR